MSALSAMLAAHATHYASTELPAGTLHAAKRAVLDGLGVMLAASGASADVQPFIETARAQGCRPQATLIGSGERVGALGAALANGALAHALDYEDAFDPAPLHPNASLLPAALASAEQHACTGREFLAAVALGCDLVCRLGLSLRQPLEAGGWYPPPILGAFGAVLAAARVYRLDARQLRDAWSLLLTQNSCPGEIKYSADTVLRAVREAFPAHAALLCVQLAARGVRGFDAPFEGRAGFYALFAGGHFEPRALTEGLGERFWIEQLSFKPWPACRGTHAFIEAAQLLKRHGGFLPGQIESILCTGGEVQRMLAEPAEQKCRPRTPIDAKFSLPFTVALALQEPEVTLASFDEKHLTDPTLLALAARCRYAVSDRDRNSAAGGGLTLRLRDGRTLEQHIARPLGDPSRPLSDEALVRKFVDCSALAARPLPAAAAHQLAGRILSLESAPAVAPVLLESG